MPEEKKEFALSREEVIQVVHHLQTMFEQFWEIVQPHDDLRIRRFLTAKDQIHRILAGLGIEPKKGGQRK